VSPFAVAQISSYQIQKINYLEGLIDEPTNEI